MADSHADSCSRNADWYQSLALHKDLRYLAQSAQEEKNDKNNAAQFAQEEKKEKDDKMVWANRLVSGVHVVIDASVKPLKRRRHKSPE